MGIKDKLERVKSEIGENTKLVAVTKTFSIEQIMEAYDTGHRIFGENRQQELSAKYEELPKDIEWHMIGSLQRNKVKYIAPYIALIHSVDSARLMQRIDLEARKNDRVIDLLLQVLVADEQSKSGWERSALEKFISEGRHKEFKNIRIRGIMGMSTLTDNKEQVRAEFNELHDCFTFLRNNYFGEEFDTLSMGMSSDYQLAVECGSNMVRVGSLIFGDR